MKLFVLLFLAVFASDKKENDIANDQNYGENNEENSIFVKIEEDQYEKVNKSSRFIGVSYYERNSKWYARRWSSKENKCAYNGSYDDEETAAHASDTLARNLMKNSEQNHKLNFPNDHTEVHREKRFSSKFIGVNYNKRDSKWYARRWSKNENKQLFMFNGSYDDEERAAHASDTLARKLMKNGENAHTLNFPDDHTEVYKEEKNTISKFIGVSYNKNNSKWYVRKWSKHKNKNVYNGCHDDEETAAHASDTLARKLIENGEKNHKLNFPDDDTEIFPEKKRFSSKFIGVSYCKNTSKWYAQRWSRNENKQLSNGLYDDEDTAARASDTLARKLMKNGDQNHTLNFPDDHTEVYRKEKNIISKFIGVIYNRNSSKWRVQRRSNKKKVYNGCYDDEETAAHASDTLARKLMKSGEMKLKLNFPDDDTEVYKEENKKKRKRQNEFDL